MQPEILLEQPIKGGKVIDTELACACFANFFKKVGGNFYSSPWKAFRFNDFVGSNEVNVIAVA